MTKNRFVKLKLIHRLAAEDIKVGRIDTKINIQPIINILVQGKNIARAAGYKHPTQDSVTRVNIDLLLTEIEQMLIYILELIDQIRTLEDDK